MELLSNKSDTRHWASPTGWRWLYPGSYRYLYGWRSWNVLYCVEVINL